VPISAKYGFIVWVNREPIKNRATVSRWLNGDLSGTAYDGPGRIDQQPFDHLGIWIHGKILAETKIKSSAILML
jgi:hypothetical protein